MNVHLKKLERTGGAWYGKGAAGRLARARVERAMRRTAKRQLARRVEAWAA